MSQIELVRQLAPTRVHLRSRTVSPNAGLVFDSIFDFPGGRLQRTTMVRADGTVLVRDGREVFELRPFRAIRPWPIAQRARLSQSLPATLGSDPPRRPA